MSSSLNKILLIGNLGKDPEMKVTPAGQTVTRFSLATTEQWKDPQGQKQSKTEWHSITIWGKAGEAAGKYLHKGSKIFVEGRMEYREFTGNDGVKKTFAEVQCTNWQNLSPRDDDRPTERPRNTNSQAPAPDSPSGSDYEDDIPF